MVNFQSFGGFRTIALIATVAGSAGAMASRIEVRKNDVVPIKFDSQLSTADSRRGDGFTATAESGNIFPAGTKFDGHVVKVVQKDRRHPASMDLAFDDVRLPDGSRRSIDGVPIPLTDKYVDRDHDGRYVAKASIGKDTAVGVGAVAGLVIGAILHKPFEGAFVGTLAGILVASTAGENDSVLVIKPGSEAGVLFRRDLTLEGGFASTSGPEVRDTPPDRAPASLNVRFGDRTIQYSSDLAPFQSGSVTMVPIEFTAKKLGLSYDVSDSSIFTENADHSIRFEENSSDYRVDGESEHLDAPVTLKGGVWYAPAGAFGPALAK